MRIVRRALVIIPGFLLALVFISIGVKLATWGIGIVIFAIGLALILPEGPRKAILHTAGVAHHEPGDPAGPAGVGAVLVSGTGEILAEIGRGIGRETNTVADYVALIEGLEVALDEGVGEVRVVVDSSVIAGHLVHGYRVRADHLRPLVEHARQLLDRFSSWSLTRVERRMNVRPNILADRGIELERLADAAA